MIRMYVSQFVGRNFAAEYIVAFLSAQDVRHLLDLPHMHLLTILCPFRLQVVRVL